MSQSKHTPSPWPVYGAATKTVVGPEGDILVAEASHYRPEAEANARLISAAPDLLAALVRLLEERCPFVADADSCECGENGDGVGEDGLPCEHRQAYAAIAKAKGTP